MSLRIRSNGRMMCAALTDPEPGDTYIDDTLHHAMSQVHRVIVSEDAERHEANPEWWWRGAVPSSAIVADYFAEKG